MTDLMMTKMILRMMEMKGSLDRPESVVVVGGLTKPLFPGEKFSLWGLAKFFSEAFEAANSDAQCALRTLGASPLQAFQYGLWPNARPIIWSHCLWMLEYNVRSASIIGYVGAGGIGLHLKLYADSANSWNKFSLVLLCILVIVTFLDFTGEKIRKSIRDKLDGKNPS